MIAIVGAGGHSKCVYECFYQRDQKVFGFFDDNPAKQGQEVINGLRIIGTPDIIADFKEITAIFIAIGDNKLRMEKYNYFSDKDYFFPNAEHIKAHISEFAEIGYGNFIMGPAVVNPGSKIGNMCIINTSSTIGHDCILEDAVQIGPGVNIAGGSRLKTGVFVGIGAKISPGVTIGEWAVIGSGAAVLHDVPERSFCSGIPAKVIRDYD